MQLKIIRSHLIFLILIVYSSLLKSQQMSMKPGDSLFRYSVLIDQIIDFEEVKINLLDFPCVNKYKVRNAKSPKKGYELISQSSLEEYYTVGERHLLYTGFKGIDPFLDIADKELIFLNPIQVLDFDKSRHDPLIGQSEFIVIYNANELPEKIKHFANEKDIQSIQINGLVNWKIKEGPLSKFEDYNGTIEGQIHLYELVYSVTSIRIRKTEWLDENLLDYPVLSEAFASKRSVYRSLYNKNDRIETVRLIDEPHPMLIYNSTTAIKRMPNCKNDRMDINLFPNPTYGDLNIQFNNAEVSNYDFAVYNIVGKKIWNTEIIVNSRSFMQSIQLPRLDKGVYLYTVKNDEGIRISSKRLVIVEP